MRKGNMDERRKFIEVDNHEGVKVSDLRQGMISVQAVKLQFAADFPEAVIREGAEELTLRAEEVGVRRINADWYALCQAIYQGIEGQEWETMYHYKDLQPAVGTKKPGENQKARALWAMKAAKGGEEHFMTELIERTTTQRLWRRRWNVWKPLLHVEFGFTDRFVGASVLLDGGHCCIGWARWFHSFLRIGSFAGSIELPFGLWTCCARNCKRGAWVAHCRSVWKSLPPCKGCHSEESSVVG